MKRLFEDFLRTGCQDRAYGLQMFFNDLAKAAVTVRVTARCLFIFISSEIEKNVLEYFKLLLKQRVAVDKVV